MKLNTSGIFGFLAILAMFVIAFLKHWSISWLYFVSTIVICSVAIIGLSSEEETLEEPFWAWNCALLALAAGLLIRTENWLSSLFLLGVGIALGYAMAGVLSLVAFCGISHILGLVGLVFMIVAAIAKGMGVSALYAGVALVLYGIALGSTVLGDSYRGRRKHNLMFSITPCQLLDNSETRLVWGTHLALILASVGLFVRVEQFVPPPWFLAIIEGQTATAYQVVLYAALLVASIFGGLVIPHLLFREN